MFKEYQQHEADKRLARAIFIRALADAVQGSAEAKAWLATANADLFSDGLAEKAVEALENKPEDFKKTFSKAFKEYHRSH